MNRARAGLVVLSALLVVPSARGAEPIEIKVASKTFTESVVLGELVRLLANEAGADCTHRAELGGTRVLWNALLNGDIDIYPEYTGTIAREILADQGLEGVDEIRRACATFGVVMSAPLGFDNSYALGMSPRKSDRQQIQRISDLLAHPDLRLGFSNEFMDRGDGWPALRERYRLPQTDVRGLDHDVAYRALLTGDIDVIDLYATDAKIRRYNLAVLDDNLGHFPAYEAVILMRRDLVERAPRVARSVRRLEGRIPTETMIDLNAAVEEEGKSEAEAAAAFLSDTLEVDRDVITETAVGRILRNTREHLFLVGTSMLAAICVAVPLGIYAAKRPRAGQVVLGAVGILQTIPALALLVLLMRPLTLVGIKGIEEPPAIVALFLYSLLPIVRNTYTGLLNIPLPIRESAEALGLSPAARLRLVELPMASRTILAGIKTAAVINVGFATLGALIGAGGYGQPILTGIRLDDYQLILEGAVPAAGLALLAQGGFEILERLIVPKGLRMNRTT